MRPSSVAMPFPFDLRACETFEMFPLTLSLSQWEREPKASALAFVE